MSKKKKISSKKNESNKDRLIKARKDCLKNSENFVKAIKKLENSHNNVRYHLAVLALEEIGKFEMFMANSIDDEFEIDKESLSNSSLDDHIKKLFWAIWGNFLKGGQVTLEEIDEYRGMARIIHETRLASLYVDLNSESQTLRVVSDKEVDIVVRFVEMRLAMEKRIGIRKLTKKDKKIVKWFLESSSDSEKRKILFGSKSIAKLKKLKNSNEWIKWLYDENKKAERESKQILQEELNRAKPGKEEAKKKKWEIKSRIFSASHSMRAKTFNKWNDEIVPIKLYKSKNNNEIIVQVNLDKAVHSLQVFDLAHNMTLDVITALNIKTKGFFWWYLPRHTAKFYEDIKDVEKNIKFQAEISPKLEMNWRDLKWVLKEESMPDVSLMFSYFAHLRKNKKFKFIQFYISGLSLLGSIDIHLRLEEFAFLQFYKSFEEYILLNYENENIQKVAENELSEILSDTTSLVKLLRIGKILENGEQLNNPINLTDVYGMKIHCDLLFLYSARQYMNKKIK